VQVDHRSGLIMLILLVRTSVATPATGRRSAAGDPEAFVPAALRGQGVPELPAVPRQHPADRQAASFSAALASAIAAVTSAVDGLIIVRLEPDELVTMAAIAERANLSRESIRLLSRGDSRELGLRSNFRDTVALI
jgi:hypothetical protein